MSESINCPSCGAPNLLPEGKRSMFCDFCGSTIEEEIETNSDIYKPENNLQINDFLELAKNTEASNNYEEAISYYNKVIELNIRVPEAWFGKGYCTGRSENLSTTKINEMVESFKKALEYTDSEALDEMKIKVAISIDECACAAYDLSYNHTVLFASAEGTYEGHLSITITGKQADSNNYTVLFPSLKGTYEEHLSHSISILDALEYAHSLYPTAEKILNSLINISANLLIPIKFRDSDGNHSSIKPNTNSKIKINNIRIKYTTELALLNPLLKKEIEKKIKSKLSFGVFFILVGLVICITPLFFIGIIFIIIGITKVYRANKAISENKKILMKHNT